MDQLEPLPQMRGTVHLQHRQCGRSTCRCQRGDRHPSFYLFWRQAGHLRKRYLKADEVKLVRAACETRRLRERLQRQAVREARQAWRMLAAQIREVEQHER